MTSSNQRISAEKAITCFRYPNPSWRWIDVRSEGEFAQGSFPGVVNIPLLNNSHRHQVGLTYKRLGQLAAIEKGHELVDPIRDQIVAQWIESTKPYDQALVFCWRGGLRSKISCEWMREAGLKAIQVEGGFKALRRLILNVFENPPPLLVIGGMTGSGKSKLLSLVRKSVDMEDLASHRGSAFGSFIDKVQPSQIDFENSLGLKLWGETATVAVEDESQHIGRLGVPCQLYRAMAVSPSIIVEESSRHRAINIYNEYVKTPLASGVPVEKLKQHYIDCLLKIRKRLGGLRTQNIASLIEQAFTQSGDSESAHLAWIESLLTEYYDQLYTYSLTKKERKVLFRGSFSECSQWLKEWGCHDDDSRAHL